MKVISLKYFNNWKVLIRISIKFLYQHSNFLSLHYVHIIDVFSSSFQLLLSKAQHLFHIEALLQDFLIFSLTETNWYKKHEHSCLDKLKNFVQKLYLHGILCYSIITPSIWSVFLFIHLLHDEVHAAWWGPKDNFPYKSFVFYLCSTQNFSALFCS